MNIYVATSWRNTHQPQVVAALRADGHAVYDFRHPSPQNTGFHWSEIDPQWQQWTPEIYCEKLNHCIAESGFATDMAALHWADAVVAVQPFGRSTAMELGWACGRGKLTILLLASGEPELMVKMCTHITCDLSAVRTLLQEALA